MTPAPPHAAPGAPPPCVLCGRAPVFRRQLCRSCRRKLAACDLPPDGRRRPAPAPADRLARFVAWALAAWDPVALAALREALAAKAGGP